MHCRLDSFCELAGNAGPRPEGGYELRGYDFGDRPIAVSGWRGLARLDSNQADVREKLATEIERIRSEKFSVTAARN